MAYIELFRGTSLLVQLFWLFFVLPLPPFNLELSAYTVAIVGLGLHIGAYGAEVMRGAIGSVAKGQYEACVALNMPPATRFRRVILPQALLAAIAPGTNLLIELLKNTSLVSLITLSDLSFRARQLDQATFQTLEIFSLTLLLYFVLAQVINFTMRGVERRLGRGRLRGACHEYLGLELRRADPATVAAGLDQDPGHHAGGLLIAIVLGLFLAIGRRSRQVVIAWPVTLLIEFIRSTPLLIRCTFCTTCCPTMA